MIPKNYTIHFMFINREVKAEITVINMIKIG